jgi:hypothetical protein
MRLWPRAAWALAGVVLTASSAQASGLKIWLAPGMAGYGESNCPPPSADGGSRAVTTIIDQDLCKDFEQNKAYFESQFKENMDIHFAGLIEEKPGQSLSEATSLSRRADGTLAASIHLSQLGIWKVPRNNGTTVGYLPISISLLLTNIKTGEVVFTDTLSTITPFTAENQNVVTEARRQLPKQMAVAIGELVQQAKKRFKPEPVSATAQGRIGKSYVLDKGRTAGISAGNLLDSGSNQVIVDFAGSDYSIARLVNQESRLEDDAVLIKQNLRPAAFLSKLPAMVVIGQTPKGMSPAYLKLTFENKLGSANIFNVVSVNPSLAIIRTQAGTAAETDAASLARPIPEYFVYLESFVLEPTEFPTNIPNRTIKTYEAYSFGYVTDRSGRVIHAQVANDRITDETSGISFPTQQRQEIVVTNSIDKLVTQIGLEFKLNSLRLPVSKADGQLVISDPSGTLTDGATGSVLRNAGRFGSIKVPIWRHVNESIAIAKDGRFLLQKTSDSFDDPTSSGDVFTIESGGDKPSSSGTVYGLCKAPEGLPASDLSADPLFRAIGRSRFYQATRVPLYIEDMPNQARGLLIGFKDRGEGYGITQNRKADLCIKTIFRSTYSGPAKAGKGLQAETHNMVMGYNILSDKLERLTGHGVAMDLTTSPLPNETPASDIQFGTQREFAAQFDKNASAIAAKVPLPQTEKNK